MPPAFAWMLVFQSTFPLQGTTVYVGRYAYRYAFQSTFPLQGTTISLPCDLICPGHFNPRSHCRERLEDPVKTKKIQVFQSTFPLQGTTFQRAHRLARQNISIHVPIAGNDSGETEDLNGRKIFQSTFPLQGTTVAVDQLFAVRKTFQSTFPLQGTTRLSISIYSPLSFQSTFPLQGTTANLSNF